MHFENTLTPVSLLVELTTMVSSFSGASWMVMRSISWLRPSTLLRKRGADDLDIGMGIRMVLGIGDCKTQTHRWLQLMFILHLLL